MPSPIVRLRRFLAGFPDGGAGRQPGEDGGTQALISVDLRLRSLTADGAEVRLLLTARLDSSTLPPREIERIALALVVPAAANEVGRLTLPALEADLAPALARLPDLLRIPMGRLGAELIELNLVAAEHLLATDRSSVDPAHGPD